MAGNWIPASKGLSRKREVISIASATSRSRYEIVGILLEFWSWVDEESDDGQLPSMTTGQLTSLFPETDVAFWDAVVDAGWLVQRTTALEVPNFQRWLGKSAKRRLKDSERKRDYRCPQNVRKMSASDADKKRPTTQHNTTQNKTPPLPPSSEGESEREEAAKNGNIYRSALPADNPELAAVAKRVVRFYQDRVKPAHTERGGIEAVIGQLQRDRSEEMLKNAAHGYAVWCATNKPEPRFRQSVLSFFTDGTCDQFLEYDPGREERERLEELHRQRQREQEAEDAIRANPPVLSIEETLRRRKAGGSHG